MEILEQKIRRSSSLIIPDLFRDYLAYANLIADQDQVYIYMEENQIGIYEPEYWVARLNYHRNRAEYSQFLSLLKKINQGSFILQLKKNQKYYLIQQTERQVLKELSEMVRKKVKDLKKRRSAREYEILALTKIEKETRKIGNIEIYVDYDCRRNYQLEDLVSFVTKNYSAQCQIIRNSYIQQNQHKPHSFIRKASNQLQKLSQQLIHPQTQITQNRKSRKSLGVINTNRTSIPQRKSKRYLYESPPFKTPDFKQKSQRKSVTLHQIDSFEILKKMHKRDQSVKYPQTPTHQENPEVQLYLNISLGQKTQSLKKEKVRGKDKSQSDDISVDSSEVSFQKKQSLDQRESYYRKKMSIENFRQQDASDYTRDQNNQGFIDVSKDSKLYKNEKGRSKMMGQTGKSQELDKQLQETIRQIQLQRLQSQNSYSEIDSNKQNDEDFSLTSEQNLFMQQGQAQNAKNLNGPNKERKVLKTIFRKKNDNTDSADFQDLSESAERESSVKIYQQLLDCLSDHNENQKKQCDGKSESSDIDSEKSSRIQKIAESNQEQRQKHINYIPRISQQKSYSYSETKYKAKKPFFESTQR